MERAVGVTKFEGIIILKMICFMSVMNGKVGFPQGTYRGVARCASVEDVIDMQW